ncbi:MAG: chemotaxis protein CheW [Candidatus Anammoxibacter sp.]
MEDTNKNFSEIREDVQEETKEAQIKDEIQILVFNITGIKIGIDTDGIYEILDYEQAKGKGYRIFKLHEQMHFRGEKVVYKSPKVIMIEGDNKEAIGIVIEQPDEIVPVGIESIQPLPALIKSASRCMPIWGVTLNDDDIILLADTDLLVHEFQKDSR